jgi:hypothetical protein
MTLANPQCIESLLHELFEDEDANQQQQQQQQPGEASEQLRTGSGLQPTCNCADVSCWQHTALLAAFKKSEPLYNLAHPVLPRLLTTYPLTPY